MKGGNGFFPAKENTCGDCAEKRAKADTQRQACRKSQRQPCQSETRVRGSWKRQEAVAHRRGKAVFAHKAARSALLPWGIRKEVRKRRERRQYPAGETRAASEGAEPHPSAVPHQCAVGYRRQPETETRRGIPLSARAAPLLRKRQAFLRESKAGQKSESRHSRPTAKPPFSCNPSHKIKKPRKSEFFGFSCLILFYAAVGQRMTRGFVKS